MGGIDTNIAAAALAIALVAFVTALGQLLQQYFATADGYRRCQRSVMGDWAQKTRLRWRWREFRFETLYTTPEIFLRSSSGSGLPPWSSESILMTGLPESRVATLLPPHAAPSSNNSHEMVCWLPLLHSIHALTAKNASKVDAWLPAISFQERSWDFQLPDIVRPLAKTTVGTIAVIARRLGMRWQDFRPVDGVMRAEGDEQIMTATLVRSLGIVIHYSYTKAAFWAQRLEDRETYIPRLEADSLGFGRIPPFPEMGLPALTVGNSREVIASLRILEPSGECATELQELCKIHPDFHLPMGSIVAMRMPMIRQRNSPYVQIPAPSENMQGFSCSYIGRREFCVQLEHYCETHEVGNQARRIVQAGKRLLKEWDEWDLAVSRKSSYPEQGASEGHVFPAAFLEDVHDEFDNAMQWVRDNFSFSAERHLVAAHIRYGVFRQDGETNPASWGNLNLENYKIIVEGYFESWPLVYASAIASDTKYISRWSAQDVVSGTEQAWELYFDAWATLLFRACCWGACHVFVPGERVPSAFWESQLPVYIG